MSETTDETFEIVTDDGTIWSVDHEGNEYSYQLTEAERLQDSAQNPGFIPDDIPADLAGDPDGEKGDGEAHKNGARERYEDDGGNVDAVMVYDTDPTTINSDGNTDYTTMVDSDVDAVTVYDTDPTTIGSDGNTDYTTMVDSDGNTYSYQLTEAERLQDSAHNPGFIPDDLPTDLAGDLEGDKGDSEALGGDEALAGDPDAAAMAMAAIMDAQFLDLIF